MSSNPEPVHPDRQLSEDEVRRVLARATELDGALPSEPTVAQLREAAAEAGISREAFDRAVAELSAASPAPLPSRTQREPLGAGRKLARLFGSSSDHHPPDSLHPALWPVIGFSLGWVARVLRSFGNIDGVQYEALGAYGALLVGSILLVWRHAGRGSQGGFQRDTLGLWGGFALGWSLLHGSLWNDFALVTSGFWSGAALVGGMIVEWARRRRGEPAESEPGLPGTV